MENISFSMVFMILVKIKTAYLSGFLVIIFAEITERQKSGQ